MVRYANYRSKMSFTHHIMRLPEDDSTWHGCVSSLQPVRKIDHIIREAADDDRFGRRQVRTEINQGVCICELSLSESLCS